MKAFIRLNIVMLDENIYKHIEGIALRITCNIQDYRDYAHDAVAKVIENQSSFNGRGSFKAWASIVAANEIVDRLRRENKRSSVEGRFAADNAPPKDRMQAFLAASRNGANA